MWGKTPVFMIIVLWIVLAVGVAVVAGPPLHAQEEETSGAPEDDEDDVLKLSLEELINIKVYIASKSKQDIEDAPGAVSVITAGEIERMGARDLRDVLRMVPGFELGMRDLGYTRLGVRGVSTPNSEKVKILIDEIPVNEHLEGGGTVIFGELPVDDIERIEILRGPGSSLYGDSAFMGVINIITKKAGDIDGWNLRLNGGSFNTWEAGLVYGKSFENFKMKGYFNYHTTDGGEIDIGADGISNDSLNRGISLAGTEKGHTIEGRKKITAGLNLSYKNFYLKSFYVDLEKNHYLEGTGVVTEGSVSEVSQLSVMLGCRFHVGERLEIEPRVYSLLYEVDNLWENYPPGYNDEFFTYPHGQFTLNSATQKKTGLDLKLTITPYGYNTLTLGVTYEQTRFVTGGIYDNINRPELTKDNLAEVGSIMLKDPTRRVFSAFIQDQWDIRHNVLLTAGLRYDRYNDAGSTVNPRLALVWKPVEDARVKILYGRSFRAPTFVELYLWVYGGFVSGNEANKPETINTGEMELAYNFNDRLKVRANYFYNRIDNLIGQVFRFTGGVLTKIEYTNIDAVTEVRGVELELKAFFGDSSYCFVNYSYQTGKNKENQASLTGMARHILNAGVNLELSEKFNLNVMANMVGPRKRDAGDLRERLKEYALVNAALTWNAPVKGMKWYASVYNLLNADCRYPDAGGSLTYDYPLPNSTRSFRIGVSYSY